ncbi:MAG: hypothetical protein HC874_06800 [Richelia sp. SL_2_1]|nr:hypothetical protein [Richelia sp. SM1_7_0]NJO27280.1 hypothetical protein [Richelia sp. SL_2_1]
MAIASLELDNLNLVDLNDEESAAVNGGLVGALISVLGVTVPIAVQGLNDPNSNARQILIDQIIQAGPAAAIGVIGAAAGAIIAGVPLTATAASLGK